MALAQFLPTKITDRRKAQEAAASSMVKMLRLSLPILAVILYSLTIAKMHHFLINYCFMQETLLHFEAHAAGNNLLENIFQALKAPFISCSSELRHS
jgi:hypothetical protein